MKARFLVSASAGLWLASTVAGQQQPELEFIRGTFVGENFFVTFRPNTTQWMRLEISSDLSSWTELVSIATTNLAGAVLYGDDTAQRAGRRFYRITYPSRVLEEAHSLWQAQNLDAYRFQLRRVGPPSDRSSTIPVVLTGTVTVRAGQKTVTDVEVNFQPAAEFNPADFPTVAEMFDLLAEAATGGVRLVWARYDPNRGFPLRCLIDRQGSADGSLVRYELSDLAPLASTARSRE
jgi:hypothetical protein